MSSARRSTRLAANPTPPDLYKPVNAALDSAINGKRSASTRKATHPPQKRKAPSSSTKAKPSKASKTTKATKATKATTLEPEFKVPTTPASKRRKAANDTSPEKPPPFTPTPSNVGLIAESDGSKAPSLSRPAEPHTTNAPLRTPKGSQVINPISWSPTKKSSTTTANLLEEACKHLIEVDPKMRPLVEKHSCKTFTPEGLAEEIDPFRSLVSGILGQQVSGAAAAAIKKRFVSLFAPSDPPPPNFFPDPATVAAASLEHTRTAGLSQRKAEYIQGLAEKFASGELGTQMLIDASDEEVLEKLVAVRGLGRWSVEMFACFGLKRADVFSTGDLGVQRGMAAFMGRDVAKLKNKGGKWKYMSEQEMLDIASKFSPYRSLFMWYMWRVEDVNMSVMQANDDLEATMEGKKEKAEYALDLT